MYTVQALLSHLFSHLTLHFSNVCISSEGSEGQKYWSVRRKIQRSVQIQVQDKKDLYQLWIRSEGCSWPAQRRNRSVQIQNQIQVQDLDQNQTRSYYGTKEKFQD